MLGLEKLSQFKKIVIIAIFILLFGGCGYLVYTNFVSKKSPEVSKEQGTETSLTNTPIITKFNQELFTSPQMVDLKRYGEWGYTNQYEGMATDTNTPFELINIQVVDPGVGGKIYLFWELPKNINFSKILIYRSTEMGSRGENIKTLSSSDTFYQDDNVENGKTYYYLVKTVNEADKESENTEQIASQSTDVFPPPPPKDVRIVDLGDKTSVEVAWLPPDDLDFDFVRIYRSSQRGKIGTVLVDRTNGWPCQKSEKNYYCIVDKVPSNVSYYYTLISVDKWGNESPRRILANPARINPFESLTQ